MPRIRREHQAKPPELRRTLWRCDQCDALIAIYSIELIDLPTCPICRELIMDSLGSFENILGMASS